MKKVKKNVCVICPKHGEFFVTPNSHLNGKKCPRCVQEQRANNFIKQAKEIHSNKYDYSSVEYKGSKTKVCIVCPEHGEFWQLPSSHLQGNGCQLCKQSLLENEVSNLVKENKIKFITQKRFNWLGLQSLDFYLPEHKIAIECQGIQHFKTVKNWGGDEELNHRKNLDARKKSLCEEHGIKILYFTHENYQTFLGEKLIKTNDELLNNIKKYVFKKGSETDKQ